MAKKMSHSSEPETEVTGAFAGVMVEAHGDHVHVWAAEPNVDDPYRHVCACGETKSEPPPTA